METESILRFLVLFIGFYMAWNIGANDVSNAMGTSVGSGALTLRRAVILAAILEFAGAFFVGSNVSETMQKGLIDTEIFTHQPNVLVIGMCAALLGTSLWLQLASYCGWPVSTTHAIVGAITGFGLLVGGVEAIHWKEIGSIAASWVLSPALSAVISFLIFSVLQKKILYALNPTEATRQYMPLLFLITLSTFTISLIFNGLDNLQLDISFPAAVGIALLVGGAAYLVTYLIIHRKKEFAYESEQASRLTSHTVVSLDKAVHHLQRVRVSTTDDVNLRVSDLLSQVKSLATELRQKSSLSDRNSEYKKTERMFSYLQIMSACFVAFAHGANDVANAIGPVAAVLDTIKNGVVSKAATVPSWLLAFGGVGIVVGLATWGWRVIETVGKKITELTPTRGFSAEFGAATTILLASKLGLPISTTHCLVGAVLGVGFARGISALNLNTLKDILLSWIITIPASAFVTGVMFYLLKWLLI